MLKIIVTRFTDIYYEKNDIIYKIFFFKELYY